MLTVTSFMRPLMETSTREGKKIPSFLQSLSVSFFFSFISHVIHIKRVNSQHSLLETT